VQNGIGEQLDGARRHLVDCLERMQEAAHAVLDDLGQPAHARRDHRDFARHRLERREAKALLH